MTGEAGRIVTVEQSIVPTSATYFYGPFGLSEIKEKRQESPQQWSEGTSTLSYDARGHLNEVRKSFLIFDRFPTNWNQTVKIEVESQGRLLRARIVTCSTSPANSFCTESSTARTYDLAGFVTSAGTTTYSVDADGWLVSREESGALDTLAVTRAGGNVVEEQFTQAYPSMFYGRSRPQLVRYEWGRLPVEPLFAPRALTGLKGADYFGIISSHDR